MNRWYFAGYFHHVKIAVIFIASITHAESLKTKTPQLGPDEMELEEIGERIIQRNATDISSVFLAASGISSNASRTEFARLLTDASKMLRIAAPRILYIVDAAVKEPPKDWAGVVDTTADFAHQLRSYGCNGVVPLELANAEDNDPTVINKLADVSAVYIEDGNPYYLMYQLRRTGSDTAIKDFMNYGGLYGGSGAGAIVAGSSLIAYKESREKDDVQRKGSDWDLEQLTMSFRGLGLVNDKSVVTIDSDHTVKNQSDLVVLKGDECWIKDRHGIRFGCAIKTNTNTTNNIKTSTIKINTTKTNATKTNATKTNATKTSTSQTSTSKAAGTAKKDATGEAKKTDKSEKELLLRVVETEKGTKVGIEENEN